MISKSNLFRVWLSATVLSLIYLTLNYKSFFYFLEANIPASVEVLFGGDNSGIHVIPVFEKNVYKFPTFNSRHKPGFKSYRINHTKPGPVNSFSSTGRVYSNSVFDEKINTYHSSGTKVTSNFYKISNSKKNNEVHNSYSYTLTLPFKSDLPMQISTLFTQNNNANTPFASTNSNRFNANLDIDPDPEGPEGNPLPLGNGFLELFVLACLYLIYKVFRLRTVANSDNLMQVRNKLLS